MLTVGQVAKQAGIGVHAVHYYEREGILPRASRTRSGYRKFPEDAVRIIRFVKEAQELGFSLDEIKQLLRLRSSKRTNCNRVQKVAQDKIAVVSEKIDNLERIKSALETLVRSCKRRESDLKCPILENLEKTA